MDEPATTVEIPVTAVHEPTTNVPLTQTLTDAGILVAVALVAYLIVRIPLVRTVQALVRRSRTWWDDLLANRYVLERSALLVPLVVLDVGIDFVHGIPGDTEQLIHRIVRVCMVVVVAAAISALLGAINAIYGRYEISRHRPIKGYLQVARLLGSAFALALIVGLLIDRSPWFFISGLGAMTAVLLLIFRDTLLSLVAGIQLTAYNLVRVGDWIEMPQFNADGDVIDISLNVVQVQNWDKTISVIPAHKFLDNSFRNWRGMQESGGRRIMRELHIDLTSIDFCSDDLLERLRRVQRLGSFIDQRSAEIAAWNTEHGCDPTMPVNGRRMTNVGCFRAYVSEYLRQHPLISKEMTFLVRQLAPAATGLPLQIYVFTTTTAWGDYEAIQADIFDHLLAAIQHFDLRLFQHPTGRDVRQGLVTGGVTPAASAATGG